LTNNVASKKKKRNFRFNLLKHHQLKGTIERQAFDFKLTTEKNKSATDGRSLTTSAEAVAPLRNGLSGVNQSSKFNKIEGFVRMKSRKSSDATGTVCFSMVPG
jgi:hypothetical protein